MDLCRILRESLADNYRLLEKPQFHLDCRLPNHPVMVQGNREALERLFANMLQNAGRYAHSHLDISMSESCGQVQFFSIVFTEMASIEAKAAQALGSP